MQGSLPASEQIYRVSKRLVATILVGTLLLPLFCAWFLSLPADAQISSSFEMAWDKFVASVIVAAVAAALATFVGCLFAFQIQMGMRRLGAAWSTFLLIPFVCPPMVWSLGQVYCFGAGGFVERVVGDGLRPWFDEFNRGHFLATTIVLAQIHAPLAMLIVGRGIARLPHYGLEAANHYLSGRAFVLWFVGAMRRELSAAFLLVFALSMGNFSVPHTFQCHLYPIEIYSRMTNYLDARGALVAAIPLLIVTLAAAALLVFSERSTELVSSQSQSYSVGTITRHGRGVRFAGLILLVTYAALVILFPIVALIWECTSLELFFRAARDAALECRNTLMIAVASTVVASVAAWSIGARTHQHQSRWSDTLALLPIGVPALIIALAYSRFYNQSWPDWLTALGNTSLLVILALGFRSWPFTTRLSSAGHRQLARESHESSKLANAGTLRRLTWLSIPLKGDYVAAGAVIAFVITLGEVEISQMLCAPGYGTLSLRLFTFLHFGPTHVAASLALLQMLIATIPVFIYFLIADRCLRVV